MTPPPVAQATMFAADSSRVAQSTSGGAPRATLDHIRAMRCIVIAEDRDGLLLRFPMTREDWRWRRLGDGWFEQGERVS